MFQITADKTLSNQTNVLRQESNDWFKNGLPLPPRLTHRAACLLRSIQSDRLLKMGAVLILHRIKCFVRTYFVELEMIGCRLA